jgi:hypothetical protein
MFRATANYSKQQAQFITNHLLPLSPNTIYSVDVSFIGDTLSAAESNESWNRRVFAPLAVAVSTFLSARPHNENGVNLEDKLNDEIPGLEVYESDGARKQFEKRFCSDCELTLMGEIEWQSHMKSKKHQKRKKGNLKRGNFTRWKEENENQKKFKIWTSEDELTNNDLSPCELNLLEKK